MMPVHYFKSPLDTDTLASNNLRDASMCLRMGIRGHDALGILEANGLQCPNKINAIIDQEEHGLSVMRVGSKEYWLISQSEVTDSKSPIREVLSAIETQSDSSNCYRLPFQYSHAHIVLQADYSAELLAKLCAIDLRSSAFDLGSLVQTSVARVSAVVASHSLEGKPVISIFCDSANVSYLWEALAFAEKEFL